MAQITAEAHSQSATALRCGNVLFATRGTLRPGILHTNMSTVGNFWLTGFDTVLTIVYNMLSDFSDYAMAFQAIVSLYGLYVQERRTDKEQDTKEFGEWLAEHRFDELKKRLMENRDLQTGIAKLLRADHAEILETLRDMDKLLMSVAGKLDGFKEISQAVSTPESKLSEQAISILVQFVKSGGDPLGYRDFGPGHPDEFMLHAWHVGDRGSIEVTEPRFIKDDLEKLIGLGFLDRKVTGDGGWLCSLTRSGQEFVCLLSDGEKVPSPTPSV